MSKSPWIVLHGGGFFGEFKSRLVAIHAADYGRKFSFGRTVPAVYPVRVKHRRTGETWEKRQGSWFKTMEGQRKRTAPPPRIDFETARRARHEPEGDA